MTFPTADELIVSTLGPCTVPCALLGSGMPFVDEAHRVLLSADVADLEPYLRSGQSPPAFEPAGPRRQVFFDPKALTCGIVTCGGLCPGINNVIRAIVLTLTYSFGVGRVLGFRYGYAGLARNAQEPLSLMPAMVDRIHEFGGTVLGSSRGPQAVSDMVDTLVRRRIGILFVIGGDGSLKGAAALSAEIARRGERIGVIGIPKTIDNDIQWITRSFGFATAVEAARMVINGAHQEALGAWNGVGLVKLMGRQAGFIAAHATLASCDVNFCLVPEAPFALDGEAGVLQALERRLERKHHAVIVVAEGAGQELIHEPGGAHDASGNVKLKDVGPFLRERIAQHFAARGAEVTVRYLDPSYSIRSQPANSMDAEFCLALGQHAVHAGMSGRTNMMVGFWNQQLTHVPIPLAVASRRQLDPDGPIWQRVLETTGQSAFSAAAGEPVSS
ncbi:MAG: ATP-dependent 6-phosphofructokinase [Deltaproteobacteria bacterium]|nr:ATP-dependent 6-phosphofructokinase [Deltaproteobacteria bacterium]MBI3388909.1 ATP-dependent 6-phosphofructokinase [Deltaproteobacteria bacterium]